MVVQDKKDNNSGSDQQPIGKRLKLAREAQGLSLDIVHEGTKIPMDALRAIEEGYSVRTLSPFYFRGFLKMYGEYLHVDVSAVIEEPDTVAKVDHYSLDEDSRSFFFRDVLANIFHVGKLQQLLTVIFILLLLFALFKVIVFCF